MLVLQSHCKRADFELKSYEDHNFVILIHYTLSNKALIIIKQKLHYLLN